MRQHLPFTAVLALTGCVLAACGSAGSPPTSSTSSAPATSAQTAGPSATSPATLPPPPATEPTAEGLEYRVSYQFGVPSTQVTVSHQLAVPPLPYLVGIYVGNHPEGSPAYQRISYYFRVGFPSYTFQYVREVLDEGRGEPISLQGNSFLHVRFVEAQAHDDAGASTVKASPPASIGFKNLRSYGFAGDFEGYVSYGLGIQVAPNSDQVLRIRAGELRKPDGSGGFYYVVHFDVETG